VNEAHPATRTSRDRLDSMRAEVCLRAKEEFRRTTVVSGKWPAFCRGLSVACCIGNSPEQWSHWLGAAIVRLKDA